jgi:hypothetical protein
MGPPIDWTVELAKKNLDACLDLALAGEPQFIRAGEETVVMVSEEWFAQHSQRKPTLKELLLNGPDLSDLDLTRDQSPEREFDWE